ncbi:MAG: S8 family serine peptidase, partial [Chthoniobacterales bacterium]
IVVAAAGNEGADNDMNPRFPANYGIDHGLDNVISVAATKENGELWYHSNYGERTVHLAAPGKSILSTAIPGDTNESLLEGSEADHPYLYKSGTSMAAPHVTAALAMMIKEFPGLTYQKLLSRLFKTTDAIPPSGGESRKVRWGRLNLARALSRDRDYSEQNAPSKERADNLNVISEASDAPEQIQKLARERREMAGQAIKYYDKAKVSFEYNNTTEPFNLAKENAGDSWDRAGDAALDAAVQIVLAIDQVKKGKSSQEWEVAAKKAKIALHCFSKAAECYKTENNHNGPDWDAIGEEILRAKEAGGDAWGSVLERSQDFIGRLPEEEQTLLRERIQQAKVQKSEEKATASTEEKVAPSNKGKEKRKSHAESVEGDEVTNTDSQQNCILSSINKK